LTFLENTSKWQSMIKNEKDERSFYFCESADWSSVILAESNSEAAGKAVKEANFIYGEGLLVSPCIRVKKIQEELEDQDIVFRIDQVFADIGMHKESKIVSEFLKDIK
jgi:hypothetical protein